jgi:hypothetical protein
VTLMIAPDESAGKREWMSALRSRFERNMKITEHHGFVNGIIMLPNCSQARAKLECEQ